MTCQERLYLLLTICLIALFIHPGVQQPGKPGGRSGSEVTEPPPYTQIQANYGRLPLSFEANQGQTDSRVRFLSRGSGYTLFLTPDEAVLSLFTPVDEKTQTPAQDAIRVRLGGASPDPVITGQEPKPGYSNYLIGDDPAAWRRRVPHYGKVKYQQVYPGIDLVYYGTGGQLEYDFIVAPGADPGAIRVHFEGVEEHRLDPEGNLHLRASGGEVMLRAPVSYQEIDGIRQEIASRFVLAEPGASTVGFEVAAYDADHPLVIDPILTYSTYLGGSGSDSGWGIAVDTSGNAYITGQTRSSNFPIQTPIQPSQGGPSNDAFVVKLNPSGTALIYATYLGGGASDQAWDIAVDASKNAYIIGNTESNNFPVQNPIQLWAGSSDAFVARLNASGTALDYSTYLGGSGYDRGEGIVVNTSGNACITGFTDSPNFPTRNAFQAVHGGFADAFVARLNASGTALDYSTYLGGSGEDGGSAIAADASGNVSITGNTSSVNFPLQNPIQAVNNGFGDAFVARLNASGTALDYSTYLGGSSQDRGEAIVVDASGAACITGWTQSTDFPLQNPIQAANAGNRDVFIAKLNASGTALDGSTYLGGSDTDMGFGIAIDGVGNVYAAGATSSTDFPTQNPIQAANAGGFDAFIIRLSPHLPGMDFATYLGGAGSAALGADQALDIAVDPNRNVYITGLTQSASFPTLMPFQAGLQGSGDAFVARLAPTSLLVSIPDTSAHYASTIDVPVYITDTTGRGIVAVEILVAYRKDIITSANIALTSTVGGVTTSSLTANGWSAVGNILPGSGNTDTLAIALSTALDTLSGAGPLIFLNLRTADIRQPATSPLELVRVLLNSGTPSALRDSGSLKITGTTCTVDAAPDSITPGLAVTITLNDPDENRDSSQTDTVRVLAFDKVYRDSQDVFLLETAPFSGQFTGVLNTAFAASAGPSFDGVIGVIPPDSICVVYVDALNSAGDTSVCADTVRVVGPGGTNAVLRASYVVQALDGRNSSRDTVRVRVTDADRNLDAGIPDQVPATITNLISGEIEIVALVETGNSTGIFQVRVPSAQGSSGTNNDGVLTLASFDTLLVRYTDNSNTQGVPVVREDTTRVVNLFGDVDPNDQIQAFDAAGILAISVGASSASAQTALVGDVDGDGLILASDAAQVMRFVVRFIGGFPVQTDVTFNPPIDLKNHPFLKPVPADRVIALGQPQPRADGAYRIPLRLAERENVLSGTLRISHSVGLRVLDVTLDDAYGQFMIAHHGEPGALRIAFAGSGSELSGSGAVFWLTVRPEGGVLPRISLEDVYLNGTSLTPAFRPEILAPDPGEDLPKVYALHPNRPNPFNPQTTIRYDLPENAQVHLVIHNLMGQRVRTLVSARQKAGTHRVVWDGRDARGRSVSSGVYFYRIESGHFTRTRQMLLLK